MGIHRCSQTQATICMYGLGKLNKHNTATKETKSLRQAGNQINHNYNKEYNIEIMIDLMPIELMIQKTGISAYIRLKAQLANPFDTKTKTKPHLQYWDNLITELGIETPTTDACNTRVWE